MLKNTLKSMLVSTYAYLPIQHLRRKKVLILMYHGFYDDKRPTGIEQCGSRWCGISDFEKQLDHLGSSYNVVSLDQLVAHLDGNSKLPDKSTIITMDDGYESNYSLAYPLLANRRMPFTVFVTTDFVDKRRLLWPDRVESAVWNVATRYIVVNYVGSDKCKYKTTDDLAKLEAVIQIKQRLQEYSQVERESLICQIEDQCAVDISCSDNAMDLQRPLTWEQIVEMKHSGFMSIGSHTVSHPNLTHCSDDILSHELNDSKRVIEANTGSKCSYFCYPGGAFDPRVEAFVEKAGYTCSVVIKGQSNSRTFPNKFAITRLGIPREMKLNEFIVKLCTC